MTTEEQALEELKKAHISLGHVALKCDTKSDAYTRIMDMLITMEKMIRWLEEVTNSYNNKRK